jgi:hypothetical protein
MALDLVIDRHVPLRHLHALYHRLPIRHLNPPRYHPTTDENKVLGIKANYRVNTTVFLLTRFQVPMPKAIRNNAFISI